MTKRLLALGILGGLFYLTIKDAFAVIPQTKRREPMIPIKNNSKPKWEIPENGKRFEEYFTNAEYMYRLPKGMLARVAWQESRFRDDIIQGRTLSSAGAVGIMQIVPKWHPDVDPLNPRDSIYYAARYLRRLYDRFGDWKMALAAYNWGQGNLSRKGFENAPKETRDYVAQISADIGLA